MTIDRMTLKTLVERGSDDDLLREMMAYVANRMMDMEVEGLTGAAHGERTPARLNPRNGYRAAKGPLSIQGHDPTTDLLFRNIRIAELGK